MTRPPRPRLPGRPRGVTLIEMLFTLVLFGIIAGGLVMSFTMSHRAFTTADASVYVQQQARHAFTEMTQELHTAGGVVAAAGNQLAVQLDLGYNLAAPCPANAVCWGARDQAGAVQSGWSIRYRQNGTQLLREILNTAGVVQVGTRVLANDVTQATFTYTGATRTVAVQLQVRRASPNLPGGSIAAAPNALMTTIRLRNP